MILKWVEKIYFKNYLPQNRKHYQKTSCLLQAQEVLQKKDLDPKEKMGGHCETIKKKYKYKKLVDWFKILL